MVLADVFIAVVDTDMLTGDVGDLELGPDVDVEVIMFDWYLQTSSLVLKELHRDRLQLAEQAYAPPPIGRCTEVKSCENTTFL